MLSLQGVNARYGKSHVLNDVSLAVGDAEVVALLGRNGAGKTTTLKSVMGLVKSTGKMSYNQMDLHGASTFKIARHGIAYVPENRGVFARLSVEENLRIAVRKGAEWQLDTVYEHFPALADRRRSMGDQLSGGEQQMLVVARALVNAPSLILLDEPSEGLAPVIVDRLRQIVHMVRDLGISILLVEQNINFCLQVADRVYVLDNGRIVFEGSRNEFEEDDTVRDTYLSLRSVPG